MHTRGIISTSGKDGTCGKCEFFRRHYWYDADRTEFHMMAVGTCRYPRIKDRLANETCPHFKARVYQGMSAYLEIPADLHEELDELKRKDFRDQSQADMIRHLLDLGLEVGRNVTDKEATMSG